MSYGTIKVDTITFTDDGSDVSVSVSGLAKNPTISGNLTVTGNISGTVIQGSTTVSGATVTGTTANFISGVYTTQLSGATITGDAGQFTTLTGNTAGFTTVTGTTVTGTTGNFVSGVFTTQVSGTTVTGNTGQFTTLTGGTAGFTTVTGTTVTGTTANFATVSGTTVTGNAGNFTTATVTSGVFASGTAAAPSVSVGTTDNGLYSPGTDQVALSTNGTGRLFVDASGNVGIGASSLGGKLHVAGGRLIAEGNNQWALQVLNGATAGGILGTFGLGEISFYNELGQENMRITKYGSVGIGTSTPSSKLTVAGNIGVVGPTNQSNLINITDNLTYSIELGRSKDNTGSFGYLGGASGTGLTLGANNIEAVRIDTSGRVGIGTSSLNTKFDVAGSSQGYTTAPAITFTDTGSGQATANRWIAGNLAVVNYGDFALAVAPNTTSTSFSPKIVVTEAGNVGIGTTSPEGTLHVNAGGTYPSYSNLIFKSSANYETTLYLNNGSSGHHQITANAYTEALTINAPYSTQGNIRFNTAGSERLRIDSSGRLLVGTSTARTNFFNTSFSIQQQLEGTNTATSSSALVANYNGVGGESYLVFAKSRGSAIGANTLVLNGDSLGTTVFMGSDGAEFVPAASIKAQVDGTPGANDMPGRLVFSVTADGAASPTEALRISSNRAITVSDGGNVVLGTTTGTKIGTSTSQKIGFFDETPIVQPTTGIAEAAFVENSGGTAVNVDSTFGGYTIQQVVQALQSLGLLA